MLRAMVSVPAGERFARAIAAKDRPALLEVLAPDVDFRAMTPGRFWESNGATEVVDDVIFGRWFDETDRIDGVETIETGSVIDRERITYRFLVTNDDGVFSVEQSAYFEVRDDRISWLRVMCAGYQPMAGPTTPAA
jgi:hypothetical protein